MIKINGENKQINEINLLEYLRSCGYKPEVVAVEVNGEIVKKCNFDKVILRNGDSVEIVSFVGGG